VIRGLFIAILGTLALATTIILIFLAKPRVFLNESVLTYVASLLSKSGTAITWTSVDIEAESVSFFKKRVTLDFTGLCVREATLSAYNGCFDRALISATGGLVRFIPKITEAGPISFENGKLLVDLDRMDKVGQRKPKNEPKKKAKPFRVEEIAPGFLRGAKFNPIDFELSRFELRSKQKRIDGSLNLKEKDSHIALSGSASSSSAGRKERPETYDLSLDLVNDQDFWAWNHWNIHGSAQAKLADQREVQVALNVLPRFVSINQPVQGKWKLKKTQKADAVALDFNIEGKSVKARQKLAAAIHGSYNPEKLVAQIEGDARYLIPQITHLSLKTCGLTVERKLDGKSQGDSHYLADCQVMGTVPIPPERLRFLEIPTEAGVKLKADLMSSDFIPSDTTQLQGNVDVVADPVLTPLFEGRGEVHSKLLGVVGEFPRSGQVDSRVAIELRIPDFKKLATKLNKTAWGVPAPFQALEGDVTFKTGGNASLEQGIFPLQLQTRLKSNSQSMNLDAGGTVEVSDIRTDPYTQLNFAVTLSDLKILLPKLKIERPPRLVPDDRIHSLSQAGSAKEKVASKEEPSFGYRAVIRTPPGKPVQIVTNLAKAPIPVNLDINLASETPPVGTIKVGAFPVEAFRRKATVQRFDIDLVPKAGDSAIDGRVDVPLGDYQTHIDVVGSIDKPEVKVTSDPPVGEDQLLAALLFNRTPEELDPSESATVGSTRATVSQGALSLASLFLLASTPIEALTYNPDTGQVTAQVRLTEGLSLNVGSGENQAGSLGLRKRIGSNLFVTTYVNNVIQNSSTVSAYAEWRKRY
jgi:hypothetical protein